MNASTPRRAPARAPTSSGAAPRAGEWVFTGREGYEADLLEELALAHGRDTVRRAGAALVASTMPPPRQDDRVELAFARQGFLVDAVVRAATPLELCAQVTAALRASAAARGAMTAWALHVFVPDTEVTNRFSRTAETLERAVLLRAPAVDARWADLRVPNASAARSATHGWLAQVCLLEPGVALVGGVAAADALSLHPGGRARMRVAEAAPSRAAMKLEEALDWLGHGPERGEKCVDLGAAPGGWSYVVMERGAHVVAIDPGSMAPALMARKSLEHIRGSAFDFEPDEPVDWLLCDMVWRPLEVAALLAKWARRRWARFVVANIKLPMRGKAEFLVRVRATLREGGWQGLRIRQLYHDREEVTLTAYTTR